MVRGRGSACCVCLLWSLKNGIWLTFQLVRQLNFIVDPALVVFAKLSQLPNCIFIVEVVLVASLFIVHKRRLVVVPVGPVGVIAPRARSSCPRSSTTNLTFASQPLRAVLIGWVWMSLGKEEKQETWNIATMALLGEGKKWSIANSKLLATKRPADFAGHWGKW